MEAGSSAGMPSNSSMQPDRHQLGKSRTFGVEEIERVLQILEEVAGRCHRSSHELGVIVDEPIRHDQMRLIEHSGPIGQLIVVGIGIEEKIRLPPQ